MGISLKPKISAAHVFWGGTALAAAAACMNAVSHAWVNDDAFISFRYAKNFVEGNGLVYNIGERVEGYTNFLWTMIIAAGMKLGVDPVTVATAVGTFCSVATVILFALLSRALYEQNEPIIVALPLASLALALHRDYGVYATSGLETSMFTLLVSGLFATLVLFRSRMGLLLAGLISCCAMFTRPDAAIFFLLSLLFIGVSYEKPLRRAALFGLPSLLLFLPYWMIRFAYYGDFFPNSFYAKSIAQSYYEQGWWYLWLYFSSYYVLLLALPCGAWLAIRNYRLLKDERSAFILRNPERRSAALILSILFAAGFSIFIFRIGGDFMFARFLIPVTPLLYCLLELFVKKIFVRPAAFGTVVAIVLAATFLRVDHFHGTTDFIHGIADESVYYPMDRVGLARAEGETLRKYFRKAPVKVACMGGQARLMYYAEPALAIESTTGLTDRYVAHMPLPVRGRVGHEKAAPMDYLRARGVNFMFVADSGYTNDISFEGIRGKIVVYDDSLMSILADDPNVQFIRFPKFLDSFIEHDLPGLSPRETGIAYDNFKKYYFDHNSDSLREAPFLAALRPRTR